MTLTEIIVGALQRLDRGTDNQTIDHYRGKFTLYANKAIQIIARQYRACRKETATLSGGTFRLDDLERQCVKVLDVKANGKSVDYWQEVDGSGEFVAATEEPAVDVFYRFLPQTVSSSSDVPELPKHMHDMIVNYVVACERCGGDPDTQGTASADFQLFNSQLASIERCTLGQPRARRLINY